MQQISVIIQGTAPLLMNKPALTAAVQPGMTEKQIVALKAYGDENSGFFIPGFNIFSCLVYAGFFTSLGRRRATTNNSSLVPAAIAIEDTPCFLRGTTDFKIYDFEIDKRLAVNRSTKEREMVSRPRFNAWKLAFSMQLDESLLNSEQARELVSHAGSKVGLGDFRPAKRGMFGKFKIIDFRSIKTV